MNIRWLSEARRDLDEIYDYIAQYDPEAAARTEAMIIAAPTALKRFPDMGRFGRWPQTREFIVNGSYVIAYHVTDDAIEILAVQRAEKEWPETPDAR
jgi:toxin ParE1/3/4